MIKQRWERRDDETACAGQLAIQAKRIEQLSLVFRAGVHITHALSLSHKHQMLPLRKDLRFGYEICATSNSTT